MKRCIRYLLGILILTGMIFAQRARTNMRPLPVLRGDEPNNISDIIPYLGGRQSPGDQIGMTWYEFQANGSYGQRLDVDDLRQAHIVWMWRDAVAANRYIAWNFRYSDGSYYGETQASISWSGYAQMDITRDLDPSMQRTVIAYHYNPGSGYYSWVIIDGGNGWGAFNQPGSPLVDGHLWPYIAVANNNNFIVATGD